MQIGPTGHDTEQGSVSGLPQANMVETEATAAVPGRPGQKRKREINSAERSKNFRDKKKVRVSLSYSSILILLGLVSLINYILLIDQKNCIFLY